MGTVDHTGRSNYIIVLDIGAGYQHSPSISLPPYRFCLDGNVLQSLKAAKSVLFARYGFLFCITVIILILYKIFSMF